MPDIKITTDEHGNVWLKLTNLKPSDKSEYERITEGWDFGPPQPPPCDEGIVILLGCTATGKAKSS